jgi:hypothetical protein
MSEDQHYDRMAEFAQPLTSVLDLEDFPIVEINPVECATRDLEQWKNDKKNSPRPADIYRKWAKRLRELNTDDARVILRAIMLETTMPYNELETPDFIDGYTGAIIEDDEDDYAGGPLELPEWQNFLITRMPEAYKNPDDALQAMRASSAWVGVEEEMFILEDRGYEPPTFTETVFNTDELDFMRTEIEPLAEALRKHISRMVERWQKQETIQAWVRKSVEAENFLIMLQNMLDRGEAYQDVFMLVRPFTHAYGYLEDDWALLKINEPAHHNLYDWAIDFEDMINVSEEATPLAHSYTSEDDIRDIAEQFLQELIDVVPIEGDRSPLAPDLNPILRSRYYVEGFLRAQINSSPNPSLEAWSHWRKKTSAAGSLAYETLFKKTNNRKQAMSAFWRAAITAGDVQPKPKQIAAVKPNGLKLSNGRTITWSTACKIASSEGFHNSERLLAILEDQQWAPQLVRILKT